MAKAAASGDLIAVAADAPNGGPQLVTVIDAKTRVMSVYHIDRTSGAITLKSVRSFQWDLLLEEFNGNSPSPREIRSLVGPR